MIHSTSYEKSLKGHTNFKNLGENTAKSVQCIWPFLDTRRCRAIAYYPQKGLTHFKNLGANTAKSVQCIWPFLDTRRCRANSKCQYI